jgi:NAD(P)-dependent dehydrogenase (short-subunit alcohol dehydrogenase family)
LAGKVVLLTGIGGGQGRAAALLFAREEALMVGCDVDADTAAETVASAEADGLDIASTAPVDLTDPVVARRWVEDGVRVHGRIDIVYNNASRPAIAPFPEISRGPTLSPGVIAIPSVQAQIDLLGDDAPMMSIVRTTADGRPGQPEDIAYAALFLASDEARFVNGETSLSTAGRR